jgi:outer membrane protein OmpA-like peptidoglycan-associated protein
MLNIKVLKITTLSIFAILLAFNSLAQDARVSQYNSIPLAVNPAYTGDFEGKLRVLGLAARVDNDVRYNYILNGSADVNFGRDDNWSFGLNYMRSGAPQFPVSGQYYGVSAAKRFYLDKTKLQTLRLGAQATYITGGADMSKTNYDRLLDVGAFRYLDKPISSSIVGNETTTSYLNYSVGVKYKIEIGRLKLETGFSAYNITNPNHNLQYEGVNTLLKRYRVTALSNVQYQFSDRDAVRIEHYSWKEGIFLRDYKARRDTAGVHETTYSLTWLHKIKNTTVSLGAYSRSWQAAYAVAAVNFSDRFGISASYEIPMLKDYYNVSHIELGISFYPFGKKPDIKKDTEVFRKRVTAVTPKGITVCPPCDSIKVKDPVEKPKTPDEEKTSKVVIPRVPINSNLGDAMLFADTVYYDLDKYNIRPDAQVKLNQVGRLMKRLNLTLDVQSHTDLRASIAYNKKLSERRAASVKSYLTALGVNPTNIQTSWFGKSEPVIPCSTCIDSLQEKNRRSVLMLKGFNELNLQKILDERLFGPEVTNRAQLEAKIKALLTFEETTNASFSNGVAASLGSDKYYTIEVASVNAEGETSALDLRWLNMFSERTQDGMRKYFYGLFLNKDQAQKAVESLQKLGLKNTTIKEVGLVLN